MGYFTYILPTCFNVRRKSIARVPVVSADSSINISISISISINSSGGSGNGGGGGGGGGGGSYKLTGRHSTQKS